MFEKPKKKEKKQYKGLKTYKPLQAKTRLRSVSKKKKPNYGRPMYKWHRCPFCQTYGKHYWHHVFNGPRKELSEKYNALIYPCWDCHEVSNGSIEKNAAWRLSLKQEHQRRIMKKMKWSMTDWLKEFGENYLEEKE